MSNSIGGATIELGVDSSGVDSGLDRVDSAVRRSGRTLESLGSQGRSALDGIGAGGASAAAGVDAATRNIAQQLQRAIAAFSAGKKTGSEFFEGLAARRGADLAVLGPLIAQFKELEAVQQRAAAAAAAATTAQQAAASAASDAARAQAAALREAAQAQAKSDTFLAGLREQVALHGKSADEVLRYRAAQAGAAGAAEPLIAELNRLKVAEDEVAAAARAAAQAQQQAIQVQGNRDSMLAALREQALLYGKSTEEVLRYRAAQAGIADAAEPIIQNLRRLKVAEEEAAAAARATAQAQQQAAQAQSRSDAFIAGLREQVALHGKSADEVLRYRAAQAGSAGAAEPLIQELKRLKAAEDEVAAAARLAAQAQQQAAQVQSGRDNFIAGLTQQAAAIGKTRTELLELQAAQMGLTTQAAPFIAQLRAAEQGLNNTGMSARATAAALRGVPAQFTDIITSLQGGQAPLTVLLQQGGQLKDMFGGAGNAARALGGYVLGLLTPVTIVAAAVATLAVAYVQGNREATAYNKALITTGNAAGTTAGQIGNMSRAISDSVGTQGAAAEALVAIVGTGRVSAANLQQFSLVAVQAQRALGQSVSDTAAQFADLAKAPVATLIKLNEQYRFLTPEVYRQVKALEVQGRTFEAGATAQTAYATAFGGIAVKVEANLGALQKGWKGVKDVAKGAWDAMLNVGREDSLEEKLKKVQASIKKAQGPFDPSVGGNSEARSQLNSNLALEASLKKQIALGAEKADADAKSAKLREAGLAWAQEEEKYLTRAQLRDQEIAKARTQGKEAGIDPAAVEERIGAIRKKYADVFNLTIDSQIEALKRRGAIEEELAKRSAMSLASVRAAGLATSLAAQFEYAEQVAKLDQEAFAREKAQLQAELALTAGKPNSQKEQAALRGQIAEVEAKALTRTLQLKNEIFELDVKDSRLASANLSALTDARGDELAALESQVLAQRDANALIGASANQVAEFNRKLREEAAIRKEVEAGILDTIIGREAEAEKLRASAAAMRDLGAAQAEAVVKSAQFEQQKKIWESIDQTAHDTFVSIFDSGKNAFDRLRDTLKNGLLDLLYQMTIKKWVFNIGAQVSGFAGIGNIGTPPSSAAGGAGQVGSLLQTGKGIYDAISTGFAGMTASLGSGIASLGTTLGATSLQGFGMGLGSAGTSAAGQAYLAENVAGYSGGAAAAPYVTAAAGIAAGVLAGKAISGQYSVIGGSGNAAVGIGTAIGTIWGPIGSAIGGAIGGLVNRAFGMGDKKVSSAGITGTITADSFTGNNYSNWMQKGGWFRSDKSGTEKTAVDAGVGQAFVDTYAKLKSVSGDFAKTLGVDIASLATRSQELNITLTQDAEANKVAIAKFFGGVADTLAAELVPSLAQFAAEGEVASATLQRLAGDYKAVDLVLTTIGRTSQEAFGAVGVASIAARERLIAAAGGLDALASGTAYFAQNFLSPEEQMAPIIANVKKQLADLGLAGVSTSDGFKNAVLDLAKGGKLATEAGAAQYAALLQLAPQFKQMIDYTQQLTGALKDQEAAQAAIEAAKSAVEAARSELSAAYDRESGALKSVIQAKLAEAAATKKQMEALKLGALSTLSPEQKLAETKRQFDAASGSEKDALASTYLEALKGYYGSTEAYAEGYAKVQAALALSAASSSAEATVAQQQLTAMDKQAALLLGIKGDTATFAQALANLTGLIQAGGSQKGASDRQIEDLYAALLGRQADASGKAFWSSMAAAGASLSDLIAGIKNSPEYIKLHGAHAAGGIAMDWSLVGEKGPELVNFSQPGRVYTATQTREMFGGAAPDPEVARLLREVLVELRADKSQRGEVGKQTLEKLDKMADELLGVKRKLVSA